MPRNLGPTGHRLSFPFYVLAATGSCLRLGRVLARPSTPRRRVLVPASACAAPGWARDSVSVMPDPGSGTDDDHDTGRPRHGEGTGEGTGTGAGSEGQATDPGDEQYCAGIIDLLGVLAYGELTGFLRLAADAEMAPNPQSTADLARMAVGEFAHYEALSTRISELGGDPQQAMAPFVRPVDAFHERTRPTGYLESLVKAYVGDGIATDFYREISEYVDQSTRILVHSVLDDSGQAQFAVRAVREAISARPAIAGRLALWGRRLVGEALSQAQRVAVERDDLAALIVGSPARPGVDLAELGRMFTRLTDAHTARMERLGLSA